jgi:hypothetical protein
VAGQPAQGSPPVFEAADVPKPDAPRVGSGDVLVGAGIGIVLLAFVVSSET